MIEILNKDQSLRNFIDSSDMLRNQIRFNDMKIFINERCIAELENDGFFRSRDLSGFDFHEIKVFQNLLSMCQTLLTIESKEVRKMQERRVIK